MVSLQGHYSLVNVLPSSTPVAEKIDMDMATSTETDDGEMIVKRVSVPIGLEELMEGLTKEVIKRKPKDIYVFASEYFANLLTQREKGSFKGTIGRRAQSVTKQFNAENVEKKLKIQSKSVDPLKQFSRQTTLRGDSPGKKTLTTKKIVLTSKENKTEKSDKTKSFLDKRRARKDSRENLFNKNKALAKDENTTKKTPRGKEKSASKSEVVLSETLREGTQRKPQEKQTQKKHNSKEMIGGKDIVGSFISHSKLYPSLDNEQIPESEIKDNAREEQDEEKLSSRNESLEETHNNKQENKNDETTIEHTVESNISLPLKLEEEVPKDENKENREMTTAVDEEKLSSKNDATVPKTSEEIAANRQEKQLEESNNLNTTSSLTTSTDESKVEVEEHVEKMLENNQQEINDIKSAAVEPIASSLLLQNSEDVSCVGCSMKTDGAVDLLKVSTTSADDAKAMTESVKIEQENLNENATTNEKLPKVIESIDEVDHKAGENKQKEEDAETETSDTQYEETQDSNHRDENEERESDDNENKTKTVPIITQHTTEKPENQLKEVVDKAEEGESEISSKSLEKAKTENQNDESSDGPVVDNDVEMLKATKMEAIDDNKVKKISLADAVLKIQALWRGFRVRKHNEKSNKTGRHLDNIRMKPEIREQDVLDKGNLPEDVNKETNDQVIQQPEENIQQQIKYGDNACEENNNNVEVIEEASTTQKSEELLKNENKLLKEDNNEELSKTVLGADSINSSVVEEKNKNIVDLKESPKEDGKSRDNANVSLLKNFIQNVTQVFTKPSEEEKVEKSTQLTKGKEVAKAKKTLAKTLSEELLRMDKDKDKKIKARRIKSVDISKKSDHLRSKSNTKNLSATLPNGKLPNNTNEPVDQTRKKISKRSISADPSQKTVKNLANLLPHPSLDSSHIDKKRKEEKPKSSKDYSKIKQEVDERTDLIKNEEPHRIIKSITEVVAAVKIQSVWRGFKARKQFQSLKKRDQNQRDENLNGLKSQIDEETKESTTQVEAQAQLETKVSAKTKEYSMADAVLKIQAAWRGFKTRKRIQNEKFTTQSKASKEMVVANELEKSKTAKLDSGMEQNSMAEAVLKIQAIWRGFRVRKRIQKQKATTQEIIEKPTTENKIETSTTTKIETNVNDKKDKLKQVSVADAVLIIQALWRGFKVRKYLQNGKLFGTTVETAPKTKEDLELPKTINEDEAVSKIQALWRGHKVRKSINDVNVKLSELQKPSGCDELSDQRGLSNDDIFKAAAKIQAGVRGYMVRKNKSNVNGLKSITEEPQCEEKLDDGHILEAIAKLEDVPTESPLKTYLERTESETAVKEQIKNISQSGTDEIKAEIANQTGSDTSKNNQMIDIREDNKKTENEIVFANDELNSFTNKLSALDTSAIISDSISNSDVNRNEVDPISHKTQEDTRPASDILQESTNTENIVNRTGKDNKFNVQNIDSAEEKTNLTGSSDDVQHREKKETLMSQGSTTSLDSVITVIFRDKEVAKDDQQLEKEENDKVATQKVDGDHETNPEEVETTDSINDGVKNEEKEMQIESEEKDKNIVGTSIPHEHLRSVESENKVDEKEGIDNDAVKKSTKTEETEHFTDGTEQKVQPEENVKEKHEKNENVLIQNIEVENSEKCEEYKTEVEETDNKFKKEMISSSGIINKDVLQTYKDIPDTLEDINNEQTKKLIKENSKEKSSTIEDNTLTENGKIEKIKIEDKIHDFNTICQTDEQNTEQLKTDTSKQEIMIKEEDKGVEKSKSNDETTATSENAEHQENINKTNTYIENISKQDVEHTNTAATAENNVDKINTNIKSAELVIETATNKVETILTEDSDKYINKNEHNHERESEEVASDDTTTQETKEHGKSVNKSDKVSAENVLNNDGNNTNTTIETTLEPNKDDLKEIEKNADLKSQTVGENIEPQLHKTEKESTNTAKVHEGEHDAKSELETNITEAIKDTTNENLTTENKQQNDSDQEVPKRDKETVKSKLDVSIINEELNNNEKVVSSETVPSLISEIAHNKLNKTELENEIENITHRFKQSLNTEMKTIDENPEGLKLGMNQKLDGNEFESMSTINNENGNNKLDKTSLEHEIQTHLEHHEKQKNNSEESNSIRSDAENKNTDELAKTETGSHFEIVGRELSDIKEEETIDSEYKTKSTDDQTLDNLKEIGKGDEREEDGNKLNLLSINSENGELEQVKINQTGTLEVKPQTMDKETLVHMEDIKKPSAPPFHLVHSGEFHDTITVPISLSPPATKTPSPNAETQTPPPPGLVHSGELHDNVLPLSVQLDDGSPAGAEVLTSSSSESIVGGQERAQASNKDASTCGPQSDTATPPPDSMETEKRNNASVQKKSMEAEAATKIQAGFRGYQVRKQLKNKISSPGDISSQRRSARRKSSGRITESGRIVQPKNKTPDIEEKSAVKIQAGVRGFLVRRRQKKQKQKESA